jgi:hypothetical protein
MKRKKGFKLGTNKRKDYQSPNKRKQIFNIYLEEQRQQLKV